MKKLLLLGFALTGLLVGCQNVRYGQIDCSILEGKTARLCQEYRQKKADADVREKVTELLQGYRDCLKKQQEEINTPVVGRTPRDCEGYKQALVALQPLLESLSAQDKQ